MESDRKRDFPMVRSKIIETSLSNNWEDAQKEWSLIDIHEEGDQRYTDTCELCNHVGLGLNYEIYNANTQKSFLVGSDCIKRFIKLDGVETLEDSSVLFEMKSEELIAIRILQNLLPAILGVPKPQDLVRFRRYAEKLLGSSSQNVTKNKWDYFLKQLFLGQMPPKEKIDPIRYALFSTRSIKVQKVKLSTAAEHRKVGSWAGTSKVKTRAETSLARSEIFRNPQKQSEPS